MVDGEGGEIGGVECHLEEEVEEGLGAGVGGGEKVCYVGLDWRLSRVWGSWEMRTYSMK